jgi:type I restriction enzyme R subunit
MPKFTEQSVVEDYIIDQLVAKGWKFIPADELERESLEEPLLIPNLVRGLKRINADIGIGDDEIKQVLNELKFRSSGFEGVKQILNFFKQGVAVKFEKEKVLKYVRLFDYEEIDKNEFIVSRQAKYGSGDKEIRVDIILYLNGIPLVIIECKNPADFSVNWLDAYKQIKDYEKECPELFKYVQIGIAAEQIAKYFPIVPWQEEAKTYEWKEELKDSLDSTIGMLAKDTLLDLIKHFVFIRVERGKTTKVIARYMQYRAVNKIVDRVLKNLKGEEKKDKGLIWHWQGSGKTLTMIFAADKLYHNKELGNPTIFFIVDRTELEEQLYQEFGALDITKPEVIGSIDDLKRVITHDEGRGKRGILITLIHKFRPEELAQLEKQIEEIAKKKDTIINRKNVFAFVDEGHRTQYGTLAAQMRSILRSAFFFAFTGTPIAKKGRDTYIEFCPQGEKYLDKYFITDSIEDGFTIKIVYRPRLEKEVHLKKDLLETFLEQDLEEVPEEIRKDVEERVKKKLNAIRVFLKNPKRIEMVSEDISQNFKDNVEGKFKAMVVAVDREACVLYKRALDELLPNEYSEVVMTFKRKDPPLIQTYLKELEARYKGKEIEDIRKELVEKFKEEQLPKILIVTDMLLTGFDAPILQTMYLDKPLKEHRLLQAIARTNRPFNDVKEAGIIMDYVGVFSEFEKAFEIYSKEEIKNAVYNLDQIRKEFVDIINRILDSFKEVPKDKFDRGTLLRAIEILTEKEETAKDFLKDYRKLRKLFEILGPDTIKARLFSEYKWITAIYTYYIRLVRREDPDVVEKYANKYFKKTIESVYETTELDEIRRDLPLIPFDENYLKKLEEKFKSKKEKAANIVFTLNRFVLVERHRNPIYESLADKVERILNLWKEKTRDFEKIYKEGLKIIEQINALSDRQKRLGFSRMEYAILLVLEDKFGEKPELIKDVKVLSEKLRPYMFLGWTTQQTAKKNIGREVRAFLMRIKIGRDDRESLYEKIMRGVENHGKES